MDIILLKKKNRECKSGGRSGVVGAISKVNSSHAAGEGLMTRRGAVWLIAYCAVCLLQRRRRLSCYVPVVGRRRRAACSKSVDGRAAVGARVCVYVRDVAVVPVCFDRQNDNGAP